MAMTEVSKPIRISIPLSVARSPHAQGAGGGGRRRRANRHGLSDQLRGESDDEAHHEDGRGCHDDQVNGPRVVASTHKVQVTGPAFVSIHVKVHGSGLLRGEAYPEQSQIGHDKAPHCLCRVPPFPAAWDHLDGRDKKKLRERTPCARSSGGSLALARSAMGEFEHGSGPPKDEARAAMRRGPPITAFRAFHIIP